MVFRLNFAELPLLCTTKVVCGSPGGKLNIFFVIYFDIQSTVIAELLLWQCCVDTLNIDGSMVCI